jgi:hypothetical protein
MKERYQLEEPGVRRENNNKMDSQEVGWWT